MKRRPTYVDLFGELTAIGFEAIAAEGEVAYFHQPTETLLRFASADWHSRVSETDLLSVEVRLSQNGLIAEPLARRFEKRGEHRST